MQLTRKQILHIAELAKLTLSDEETTLFSEQLSAILEYFTLLDELDTSEILPTAMVIEQRNVLREDVAGESLPAEAVVDQAPHARGEHVAVKAILES